MEFVIIPSHQLTELTDTVLLIVVTPNSPHFVSGGQDGVVRLWDLESGQQLWAIHPD
jgi:WD40 repeat protein